MKHRIKLNVALVLSIVLLSLTTSDSTAKAHAAVWVTVGFFEVDAPLQTVEVNTPVDNSDAVFDNYVYVRDGKASGFLTLTPGISARHQNGGNWLLGDGHVRFNGDGTLAGVRLRGRTVEGDPITVIITPGAAANCLIYTAVGSDFTATWEGKGSLTASR